MTRYPICLIVILLLSFNLIVNGQQKKIPIRTVINSLEKQYDYNFSFADELINRIKVIPPKESKLEQQLNNLASQTGLVFSEIGDQVIIIKTATRNYCLRIFDATSGLPLEGAQLLINRKPTNIISDATGKASFRDDLIYQDTLHVIYFGYLHNYITAKSFNHEDCSEVPMTFGETTLDEVIVTHYLTSGFIASQNDHSLSIKTNKLALLPGETDNDILLAIKALPGITSPNGKAGNLHLRGSTTDQTLLLFDNIPIYHKGHFFGAVSPYNPQLVEEVSVHRSGYGPDLGGRVGGAIELKTANTLPDSTTFGIGFNSYYGSGFAKIRAGEKLGISASFRSSYPGDWESPKLEAINELVFQQSIISIAEDDPNRVVTKERFTFSDANLNADYKIKNGNLSFSALKIGNNQEDEILRLSNNSITDVDTELNNWGSNLDWMQSWTPRFFSNVSLTYSAYDYYSILKENPAGAPAFIPNEFETMINDLSFEMKGNLLIGNSNQSQLAFGYQVTHHEIENSSFSNFPNRPVSDVTFTNDSYLHALFANHQILIGESFTLNTGLRGSYYTLSEDYRLEPRLFMNYALNHSLSLKSSAGWYSQFITQNVFFDFDDIKVENLRWELASDSRPFVRSEQYMLGTIWNANDLLLDLELYYKEIDNLSTAFPTPEDAIQGALKVYGADFLIRKNWGNLDAWVSYSYMLSEMYFPDLNLLNFEAYYDQPHTVNINATMPFKQWQFSLGWQFQSGVPIYTNNTFFPQPGTGGFPSQPTPIPAEEDEGRYDAQHQLDLSIVYQFPAKSKGWKGSLGLSMLNVYDQQNLVTTNYLTFGPNTILEDRFAIGFAPNLTLNLRW